MTSPLWIPDRGRIAAATITRFIAKINDRHGIALDGDYFSLQDWAVANPRDFWEGCVELL